MPTFYSVSNFDFAKRLFYKAIHKPNQNKVNKKKLLVAASHKSVILKALKKFKSLALGTFCQWKIVNIRYLASLLVHTSLLSLLKQFTYCTQFKNSLKFIEYYIQFSLAIYLLCDSLSQLCCVNGDSLKHCNRNCCIFINRQ